MPAQGQHARADRGASRRPPGAPGGRRMARVHLFVAFAFTVMADPVSSVAYAIEAALAQLDGDLGDLLPTMGLVVGTVALIAGTYHQLIRRFPNGGGGARSVAAAFGDGWAFLPLGALLVDFTLTIAVSCAAAASALIAFAPELAGWRAPLAVALAAAVATGTALGHRGRVAFATATLAFLGLALVVVVQGLLTDSGEPPSAPVADASFLPVLLAMPLGMALATGVEAPSDAIAQLGELRDRGRRLFGQLTIWLMLAIVSGLTLALTFIAVRLGVRGPGEDTTLLAELATAATGGGAVFALFQIASTLLLLAAAASSFLAGSGLLKALALHGGGGDGLVPRRFARTNRFFVPQAGLAALLAIAMILILAAGGHDQELVHFYAAAVFVSFLGAVIGCAVLSWRDRRFHALAVNLAGAVMVLLVLALNLRRLDPVIAIGAAAMISAYLWRTWVARGRPRGVERLAG